MNLGSKSKKRVVLPSRPEPPTVDQILEDINRAPPSDPVFNILEKTGHDGSDSDVDLRFRQCSQYLDLTERLQEARGRLQLQREGLQVAGERLQSDVAEGRRGTVSHQSTAGSLRHVGSSHQKRRQWQ